MDILIFAAGFGIIVLASGQIGQGFKTTGLPLISGFLFTGILAGPYVLNLIPHEAVGHLGFVDEVSLGLIAFAAGAELYIKELKSELRPIGLITSGLVLSTFFLTGSALFLLSAFIPFMKEMSVSGRIAVSVLAGAILVARSPSSAIAIVSELRARGHFTRTVLGVTVIMDVVVIVLFAAASSMADALLTGITDGFGVFLLLAGEISASVVIGKGVSRVLLGILGLPVSRPWKAGLVLLAGFLVFAASARIRHVSHGLMGVEILLEPLLICMVAGFLTANTPRFRKEFLATLNRIGPPVYIAFFTLTGAALSLDVLAATWPVALVLFGVRIGAIFLGSFTGGSLARSGLKASRTYWMAFITQAGVGLGLAKEVVVEFPEWGNPFATIIISVIVLNQIVGPPLFKLAIRRMGEDHPPAGPGGFGGNREVVIFGSDGQASALAHSLASQGRQVKLALPRGVSDNGVPDQNGLFDVQLVENLGRKSLEALGCGKAGAVVAMLSDKDNIAICETAYEHFGTPTLIARLNDRRNIKTLQALKVLIVDPSTAIVSLLDHFVRSPAAASLLMGFHRDREVADLTIKNADLSGLALRDLRLPFDAVILSVRRRGVLFVPHDFTRLETGDQVTVMGPKTALDEIALRFDHHAGQAVVNLVKKAAPPQIMGPGADKTVSRFLAPDRSDRQDRFDTLVETARVMDLKQPMDRDAFFELAARQMAKAFEVSSATLFEMFSTREDEMSTVLAPGLAVPHIIIKGENRFAMLIARNKKGILFTPDKPLVHAVFVLVGTTDERNFHLRALAAIAQIVMDPRFEKKWFRARDSRALKRLVRGAERKRDR